jgi:hypothetical protein
MLRLTQEDSRQAKKNKKSHAIGDGSEHHAAAHYRIAAKLV